MSKYWENNSDNGTFESSLELVTSKHKRRFNDGDTVVCINSKDKALTKGKQYTVSALQPDYKIDIINDKGIKCLHHEGRFELNTEHERHYMNYDTLCTPSNMVLEVPEDELIEQTMDIDEIKDFSPKVLAEAEKEAKKQLAQNQTDIATAKFIELLTLIDDAEREVARAQKRLDDLRGKATAIKPKA